MVETIDGDFLSLDCGVDPLIQYDGPGLLAYTYNDCSNDGLITFLLYHSGRPTKPRMLRPFQL